MRAVERAWKRAGVPVATVGLVEAHGTGTVVGDRTELRTLEESFAGQASDVLLGSVKSQIGHTKCAAGLAGLIKVALAVHHGVRPGMAPIKQPNGAWDAERSPFHFSSRARPWAASRRVAGVSAFGFGGTNFHAIVEAADPAPRSPRVRLAELFLLRGTDAGVDRVLDLLAARLDDAEPPSLAALALAACEAGEGPVRVAIVADGHAALRAAVSAARTRTPVDGSVWIAEGAEAGPVAFLFPGQGSQRPHMLADLFVAMPSLQGLLASDPDLARVMFPPDAYDDASRAAQRAAITDTRVAQPALGVADLAAAAFLEQCGVTAAMAGGHSYGELAALCWAGALDEDALLPLSRARAACILDAAPADPGTMAAVRGPADAVQAAIAGMAGVVIANLNAPQQTVIAGPTDAVEAAVAALGEAGLVARTIPVAAAFHSPLVAAAADTFAAALAATAWRAPAVPVWSNASGAPHPADADGIRALLARQVAEPVRFVDQIEGMYAAGARVFVETGPGRVLTGLVGRILGDRPHRAIAFDVPGEPGWAAHLGALAALAAAGVAVDAAPLFADRGLRRIALEATPARAAAPWWVNGHRAWPVVGEPVPGSLVPVPVPVGAQFAPVAGAVAADDREQAVLSFLDNMRALADAQRDVVLGLMGQAPSAPRTVSARPAPRPVADVRVIDAPPAVRHDDAPPPPASAPTDLLGTLLSVVSERTGYPAEMLDPDLDLEADLSIDSIKRIEILNAFGTRLAAGGAPTLDDRALEELATRRTLRAIVDVLDARGVGAAPVVAADDAVVDVLATLLTVVSERTGYPSEMLDPDLDLEADLSIDSIKRIEILNALGTALGGSARLDDAALEQLATERTLRGIVTRLDAARGGASAGSGAASTAAPAADNTLRRFKLVARPAPLDIPDDLASAVLPFTLVDADPARGARIRAALASRGIDVEAVSPERAVGQQAVVHVDGAGAAAVFPHLTRLLESGARTIVGVDTGEDGLDGLFKTAAREYPDRTVRLVTVDGPIDVDALADTVRPELSLIGGPAHVRYRGGVREVGAVEPAPFDAAPGPLPLDAHSVVLITGGARGITARIAMALAAEVPCHYVLVGRSPLPGPEDDDLAVARDAAALRKALLARGMTSPADIERAVQGVLKGREARGTIAAIEACGATVAYHPVDVRDAEAFEALAQQLIAEHGRIDGVVHGAGILEDRLMRDKSPDSFARVYETKVAAARVLARILPDTTRFVVFFGSISGVLGNRGQADYAAANATLDALARSLGERITGRVVSIDWGPWGGAGMVSDALARAYAQRGIGLIDVDEGVAAFLDELRRGHHDDHQVIWQAGDPRAFAGNADGA